MYNLYTSKELYELFRRMIYLKKIKFSDLIKHTNKTKSNLSSQISILCKEQLLIKEKEGKEIVISINRQKIINSFSIDPTKKSNVEKFNKAKSFNDLIKNNNKLIQEIEKKANTLDPFNHQKQYSMLDNLKSSTLNELNDSLFKLKQENVELRKEILALKRVIKNETNNFPGKNY